MDDDLTALTDLIGTDHPVTADDPSTDIDCGALAQRFQDIARRGPTVLAGPGNDSAGQP
jgi:hypothetical protein